MNIVVSRASCTSCNADGKPGASLFPSFLTSLTRTFSSLGRIRPRSRYRETGTCLIHSQYTPYVCFRESFPAAHSDELIPFLLNVTGRSISLSLGKVILRKLFVAVCYLFFAADIFINHPQLSALALRLVPQEPSRWPNWIMATSTELSNAGAATEHILDFLEIVVEEVNGADLLPAKKCEPA
jgi:hypothetical protein